VDLYPATLPDGTKIYLADTPGFDDTYRKDTDILAEVADWLNKAYESNIKLTGIVYLHRIADPRVGHATMRNIKMFQALCGDNGLGSVVLATTRWDMVDHETGRRREQELCERPQMWKRMIDHGSKVFRQDRYQESALGIIQYLINKKRRVHVRLQEEMAHGASLDETGAGKEVQAEIDKLKKKYEKELTDLRREMDEAIRRNNLERQEEIDNLKAELEVKQREMVENERKLQADREELRWQREQESRREYEALAEQVRQRDVQIAIEQQKLEQMRMQNKYDAEIRRMEAKVAQAMAEKHEAEAAQLRAEMRLRDLDNRGCIIL